MSKMFPTAQKGIVLRIYYSRPWKNAYVFIMGEVVTHASPELVFTLGWTREKVLARAEKVGFKVARQMNVSKPRDTWLSARPAPPRKTLPFPTEEKGAWDIVPFPARDARGRFVKKEKS